MTDMMPSMPRIDTNITIWLPRTVDFSAWHFKNCVDILNGTWGAQCFELPNYSKAMKKSYPDPLERYIVLSNSYEMIYTLREEAGPYYQRYSDETGESYFHFYNCVIHFNPRSILNPRGPHDEGMLFTGSYG